MKSINYSVPDTLIEEKKILELHCDLLIDEFNKRCADERQRLIEERETIRKSRVFKYSVLEIEDGWRILFREALVATGNSDDKSWSRPFKITNGVLYHRDYSHGSISYVTANALIPQGLLPEGFDLEKINVGW